MPKIFCRSSTTWPLTYLFDKGVFVKIPFSISKNKELSELYFAGVKKENNQFLTNGGRVLGMTTLANTLDNAKKMAYNNIEYCKFLGEQFRGDIGEWI